MGACIHSVTKIDGMVVPGDTVFAADGKRALKAESQEIRVLEERLATLRRVRSWLDRDIAETMADLMSARSRINHEQPGPLALERSFKAAVKHVLKSAGRAMTAPEIRTGLVEAGFPIAHYRGGPLLSIHPTLHRLIADGCVKEVACDPQRWTRKKYEWVEESNTRTA